MATEHTKGPLAVIASASGKPLIVVNHPQHTGNGDVARMADDTPEAWATAHLFKAAPELLAALEELLTAEAALQALPANNPNRAWAIADNRARIARIDATAAIAKARCA